ncbi:NAD-dependent epimerase/dehydratase family protein [Rubritepida flocculans]|uniref:NAD-dependent epimerase/dehydratase family protein n=1 Tax=Rubritepida flocculans TaxID=182403 RepID=UPI000425EFC7|nr:NAD-dependent epimerase/dehydratase family protein [Rubritepida flocculans]
MSAPLPDALIGHSGFVGGHLDRARPFAARFRSTDIAQIRGRRFGTVVCAGVSAVKWRANREPEADWAGISGLIAHLETISCARFVLVSTVDVFAEPRGVTEADTPDPARAEPYGRHRRWLEQWVEARFPDRLILRLPALFGAGLKKNALFDMMHGHLCERINPASEFQWYPLRRLADDLARAEEAGLDLLHIAPAPVATGAIRDRFFPGLALGGADAPAPRYDIRTRHAALLGGQGAYHLDAAAVMAELAAFLEAERA